MRKHFYIISLLLLLFPVLLQAQGRFQYTHNVPWNPDKQGLPERSSPPQLVNDYINLLSPTQGEYLEKKVVAYDDSTTTQIAIVIVSSIGDLSIEDFGLNLYRKWGLGNERNDNGVLITILKDDKNNKRKMNITTGYGMEGAVTDITAKSIIEDVMKPRFKESQYYEGIDEAVNSIIAAAAGRYVAPEGYHKKSKKNGGFIRIMVTIFIIFIILAVAGGGGTSGGMASRRGYTNWNPPVFTNWGGGGSSGGGGGGWSGGFGGFGGGSSGGGGASGDW